MGVQDTVAWYQKKIGTYDKQQWELTFERHIIRAYNHVKTKSARLKTELIDVDLVQGSSFSKAKPKHGLLMVAWLATLRFVFYPFCIKWWASQTSKKVCILLTTLYVLQFISILIYILKDIEEKFYENLSCTVVVIPVVIMWILSFIHSQIIATNSDPSSNKPSIFQSKVTKNVKFQQHNGESAVPRIEDISVTNRCNTTPSRQTRSQSNIDDGFESFNGVGSNSSDNGEETLFFSTIHVRPQNSHNVENGWSSGTDDTSDEFKRKKIPCIAQKKALRFRFGRNSECERLKSKLANETEKYPSEEEDGEEEEDNTESQTTTTRRYACSCKVEFSTNSEENYYATELDQSEGDNDDDIDFLSSTVLNPDCSTFDKVSCTIWENRDVKKAYLTVLDISSAIIRIVEQMPERMDYFYLGLIFSFMLAFTPIVYRLTTIDNGYNSTQELLATVDDLVQSRLDAIIDIIISIVNKALGNSFWERVMMVIASLQRFILASIFFFLLVVAERTYKQRFLYAKFFTKLTSSQKARKAELPHFRLNKVKNIKTWLSVRSYLKKRGPQRSVDVIVSSSFVITLLLLSFLSMELLKGSEALRLQCNLEALIWSFGLGIMLLRFMTLANKTYLKYRNLSVLITEQINLYLQIERKPRKKEKLSIVHNVLKLAADLLKELETPYTISGLSANPYLYTIVKVFILSALSAVLSELLGFKLKLFKLSMKH